MKKFGALIKTKETTHFILNKSHILVGNVPINIITIKDKSSLPLFLQQQLGAIQALISVNTLEIIE